MKRIFVTLVLLTLTVFTLTACSAQKPETAEVAASEIEKGKPVPAFELKDLDGGSVKLEDYKGQYVIINFWATWCSFCKIELPDLQKFQEENPDFTILAVDVGENEEIVRTFVKEQNVSLKVLLDPDSEVAREYLISAFPTSYFIDKEGNLIGTIQGAVDLDRLNELKTMIKDQYK